MPPLSATNVFTAWVFEPLSAVCVVVLAIGYIVGRRRVGHWPVARTIFFFLGLSGWALLTLWFFGAYDSTLFVIRASQTVLLLMVVPLFLTLGMPVTLLVRALPQPAADRVRAIGHSRVAKVITFPAFISIAMLGTPFAFFFTGWFTAALEHGIANDLTHLWMVGVGWAYYWTRTQVDPVPHTYSPLVSMWITFAEVIFDGGLGLVLIFGSHVLALEHWQAVRDWGPSPRTDQQWGGTAFWILGDLSGLPFLGALFRKMIRDDTDKAAEIDRELDALDAARRTATATSGSRKANAALADADVGTEIVIGPEPDDGMQAPWWEIDPSRLQR